MGQEEILAHVLNCIYLGLLKVLYTFFWLIGDCV